MSLPVVRQGPRKRALAVYSLNQLLFMKRGIIKELEKLGYDGSQDIHVADKVFNFDETA